MLVEQHEGLDPEIFQPQQFLNVGVDTHTHAHARAGARSYDKGQERGEVKWMSVRRRREAAGAELEVERNGHKT